MYFFFFNDTATTEIYTLSLHDALPICSGALGDIGAHIIDITQHLLGDRIAEVTALTETFVKERPLPGRYGGLTAQDRKSTRLNSSHANISYAVFCLKKKNIKKKHNTSR